MLLYTWFPCLDAILTAYPMVSSEDNWMAPPYAGGLSPSPQSVLYSLFWTHTEPLVCLDDNTLQVV